MRTYKPKLISRIGRSILLLVILVPFCFATQAAAGEVKGKISKNFYHFPYADGVRAEVGRDYIDHGNPDPVHLGKMDIGGITELQPLVAAAAGVVTYVVDSLDACGCTEDYGPCANEIHIRHANDEMTEYVHLVQNSALVAVGDTVAMGDIIGVEGDVGRTCSPDGRAATSGICVPTVPAGSGNCGRHLHWVVRRVSTRELLNPMICSVEGSIFHDNWTYTGEPCASVSCETEWEFDNTIVFANFGTFAVYQGIDSIVSNGNFVIEDSASVVFHSVDRIILRPGFNAKRNGYFRAEIAPCNTTPNADEF